MVNDNKITATDFKNLINKQTKGKNIFIDTETTGFTVSVDDKATRNELLKVIISFAVDNDIPTTMLEDSPAFVPKQAM